MSRKSLLILSVLFPAFHFVSAQKTSYASLKLTSEEATSITVEVNLISNRSLDSALIEFRPVEAIGLSGKWESRKQKLSRGKGKWTIRFDELASIRIPFLSKSNYWMAEPGDSITVSIDGNNLQFSGRGAEKFILQQRLKVLRDSLKTPSKTPVILNPLSFSEYFEWMKWLDKYEQKVMALINSYGHLISQSFSDRLKDLYANDYILPTLKDLFAQLCSYAKEGKYKTVTLEDTYRIFDTTVATRAFRMIPYRTDGYLGKWTIVKALAQRRFNFDSKRDPLNSELKRTLLYYDEGNEIYKDKPKTREHFLVRLLTEEMLDDVGYTPEIREVLNKYYAEEGFEEFKSYVKAHEIKVRGLTSGAHVPDFKLTDIHGKPFSSNQLKGKIVLMDFWFTGCVGCLSMKPILEKVENEFRGDTNVVFLSISSDVDKDKWIKSIEEKKYTTGRGINLYTNGNGPNDFATEAFNVTSYPSLNLINHELTIVENPLPDPRKDNGEYLMKLIKHIRALLNDGPYVFYEKNNIKTYSINNTKLLTATYRDKKNPTFSVQTDLSGKTFSVELKHKLHSEPAEFTTPEKLFTLSDIEGNFDALKKLLQSNKIIDENYNWIFGKGHLVFAGDMFDRGEQVTECLWLVYSLEEKAKNAGGYVHFILGNHEIMNLQGDHRYVRHKYIKNASLMSKSLTSLYKEDSELGRWLRTKNIVEKIGDLLFVHGGISRELNNLAVSLGDINKLARPYYADNADTFNDPRLGTIMSSRVGPFWYRNYYLDEESKVYVGMNQVDTAYKASEDQINETLQKFNVNHIITGHTVINDTISVHYSNKVINIDTQHSSSTSEALLIEGNKYYRVNQAGNRILLFVDNIQMQVKKER